MSLSKDGKFGGKETLTGYQRSLTESRKPLVRSFSCLADRMAADPVTAMICPRLISLSEAHVAAWRTRPSLRPETYCQDPLACVAGDTLAERVVLAARTNLTICHCERSL